MQYTLNQFSEWQSSYYDDECTDAFDVDVQDAMIG